MRFALPDGEKREQFPDKQLEQNAQQSRRAPRRPGRQRHSFCWFGNETLGEVVDWKVLQEAA